MPLFEVAILGQALGYRNFNDYNDSCKYRPEEVQDRIRNLK